jgi:hypothetical protein
MVLSKILTPSRMPKDKVAGIAKTEIVPNRMAHAFILDILNLSIIVAQGPSRILIPEVTAAQKSRTKNAQEIIFPQGI